MLFRRSKATAAAEKRRALKGSRASAEERAETLVRDRRTRCSADGDSGVDDEQCAEPGGRLEPREGAVDGRERADVGVAGGVASRVSNG